ncbi:MAG: ABC transporter ATP-binding protein [Deltaproteobacteria bacterium]|nr:ABC transporter ATP-binding protein [Deltaproteobacteria bacterium]
MGPWLLEVEDLHTYYDLSHILFGVSLRVRAGEVACLLGRNGAGKTTTLRSVMGLARPQQGRVRFKGEVISGLEPFEIARRGLGYVPEDRRIFPELTVRENLEVARRGNGQRWDVERVCRLFPRLTELLNHKGGSLSGGEQQMLTIARTLMGNPEMILLDEPSEGLAPLVVQALQEQLLALKTEGIALLLSEQNLGFVSGLGDRAYIIEKGEIRYEGTLGELQANEDVRRAYLMV